MKQLRQPRTLRPSKGVMGGHTGLRAHELRTLGIEWGDRVSFYDFMTQWLGVPFLSSVDEFPEPLPLRITLGLGENKATLDIQLDQVSLCGNIHELYGYINRDTNLKSIRPFLIEGITKFPVKSGAGENKLGLSFPSHLIRAIQLPKSTKPKLKDSRIGQLVEFDQTAFHPMQEVQKGDLITVNVRGSGDSLTPVTMTFEHFNEDPATACVTSQLPEGIPLPDNVSRGKGWPAPKDEVWVRKSDIHSYEVHKVR